MIIWAVSLFVLIQNLIVLFFERHQLMPLPQMVFGLIIPELFLKNFSLYYLCFFKHFGYWEPSLLGISSNTKVEHFGNLPAGVAKTFNYLQFEIWHTCIENIHHCTFGCAQCYGHLSSDNIEVFLPALQFILR